MEEVVTVCYSSILILIDLTTMGEMVMM